MIEPLSLIDAPVGVVMTRAVKTIEADRPLEECVRLMRDNNVGSMVVVEKEKPVGMFTERDLIRKVAEGPDCLKLAMTEVMSTPLVTVLPTATVWDAISLMNRKDIRRLPVLERGKLAGIVTERDVFRLIVSQQNLLLETISESLPATTREQLKEIIGQYGLQKPFTR